MNFKLKFKEENSFFPVDFGEITRISDGGFESGYEKGYKDGNAEGYSKGKEEGLEEGYADGYEKGYLDNRDCLPDLVNDTLEEYESDKITKVRKYGFAEMSAMKRISLPNCTYLDTSAFQLNSSTEMNLPKVESVGSNSFSWCKMAKIKMPVKSIATRGFYYCSNLKALAITQSETVCTLADGMGLKGTPIEKGTGYIYVPDELVEQYKSAENWSTYAAQIKPLSEL